MQTKPTEQKPEPSPQPNRRRRRRRLLIGLLALGGLVWFLPTLILHTPLRNQVCGWLNPGLDATITVTSGNAGWLSPIVLRGVRVRDQDQTVLDIGQLSTSRTLWELISSPTDLGTFEIAGARCRVLTEPGNSNIEQIIAPMLTGESSSAFTYAVELSDAEVTLITGASGRASVIRSVEGRIASTTFGNGCPEIQLSGVASADEGHAHSGHIEFRMAWSDAGDGCRAAARLRTQQLPARSLAAIINRFSSELFIEGDVTSDLVLGWRDGDFSDCQVRGGLAVKDGIFVAPGLDDQLRLETVRIAGTMKRHADVWQFDGVHLRTDFADVRGDGVFSFADGVLQPQGSKRSVLTGKVNMAKLMSGLPRTFGVRDDVRMKSGNVRISVTGAPEESVWTATADIDQVSADHNGDLIEWLDPLRLAMTVRADSSYRLQSVRCESEFLQVKVTGVPGNLRCDYHCDLDTLGRRINQFVSLPELRLAGTAGGQATFRREALGTFNATATARGNRLVVSSGDHVWRVADLNMKAAARGRMVGQRLEDLLAFEVDVKADGDSLRVELQDLVTLDREATQSLPLRCRVTGQLRSWSDRLRPFVALPVSVDGSISLTADARLAGDQVSLNNVVLQSRNLTLASSDARFVQPALDARFSLEADRRRQSVSVTNLKVDGTDVTLEGESVRANWQKGFRVAGVVRLDADLAALSARLQQASGRPVFTEVDGRLRSSLKLTSKNNVAIATVDGTLSDSSLLARIDPPRVAGVRESMLRGNQDSAALAATVRYNNATDTIRIEKSRLDSNGLAAEISGTVKQASTRRSADLSGHVDYDFARLNNLLAQVFGTHVRLAGRGRHPFALRGALGGDRKNLSGSARLDWDSAQVFGLTAGRGVVDAVLKKGVLRCEPIQFAIGGGEARLSPRIDLRANPTLTFAKGSEIRAVRLTEEVTQEWMKYVTPLLADSARIQGKFSAAVSQASIPLNDPAAARIDGAVRIHSADAAAGPLLRKLTGAVSTLRQMLGQRSRSRFELVIPPQDVAFRMAENRVHHQYFRLEVDGVPIRTSGAIGLDETLDLTAEITIPDKWVGSVSRHLQGQTVRIPIRGNFAAPRVDSGAIRDFARRAAGSAANGLIKDQLDRGLGRLLDKIK